MRSRRFSGKSHLRTFSAPVPKRVEATTPPAFHPDASQRIRRRGLISICCHNVAVRHDPTGADIRKYFWSLVDKNGPLPDPATGVKSSAGSGSALLRIKVMAASRLATE